MLSRILKSSPSWAALALCTAALYAAGAVAGDLPGRNTEAGGVTVSVKPKQVSPGAKSWVFEVALNTHTADLADDFPRAASLVDAAGKPHAALSWEGDPVGGHHRKGALRFAPLSPRPDVLELRIQRPGEGAARTFRWRLASPPESASR